MVAVGQATVQVGVEHVAVQEQNIGLMRLPRSAVTVLVPTAPEKTVSTLGIGITSGNNGPVLAGENRFFVGVDSALNVRECGAVKRATHDRHPYWSTYSGEVKRFPVYLEYFCWVLSNSMY